MFALTIFAGAFLLFQVQPLIAKFILPWFGGSASVWTTCLLFFQVFLVAGYAYAHGSVRFLRPRAQAGLHAALLLGALAFLPIVPGGHWKPGSTGDPTLRILLLLTVCLGLPCFVLSATGPLLQSWFSRLHPGKSPYRLYALSNLGSLLALVTYPFVVEPMLTRQAQARLWAWNLVAFLVLCGACAWRVWRKDPEPGNNEPSSVPSGRPLVISARPSGNNLLRSPSGVAGEIQPDEARPPAVQARLLWFLLPLCGSVLLLGTTNKLCQDVASVPFLWVLPLSLYLLTFILCFDRPAWYARKTFMWLLVPTLALLCYGLYQRRGLLLLAQIAIYCGSLFVGCLVAHGEVYRLKPPPRFLTMFYLLIAAGGAAGGVFVAVLAPLLFRSYAELNWGVCLLAGLVCWIHARERTTWTLRGRRVPVWPAVLAGVIALGAVLVLLDQFAARDAVSISRNFHAVLRVDELERNDPEYHAYQLIHGNTDHGLQFIDPVKAAIPATSYNRPSGVGLAFNYFAGQTNRHIGVVGLGTGTLAAYGQPGDTFRFYELNAEVRRLAETRFTYLKQSKARVEVVLGDARLSLEREPAREFDLLVLDAFSSDAIPVHLLTREAFVIYLRHLKPGGVIAVHTSNLHLDLFPVVLDVVKCLRMHMVYIPWKEDPMPWGFHSSEWILVSQDRKFLYLGRDSRARAAASIAKLDERGCLDR